MNCDSKQTILLIIFKNYLYTRFFLLKSFYCVNYQDIIWFVFLSIYLILCLISFSVISIIKNLKTTWYLPQLFWAHSKKHYKPCLFLLILHLLYSQLAFTILQANKPYHILNINISTLFSCKFFIHNVISNFSLSGQFFFLIF